MIPYKSTPESRKAFLEELARMPDIPDGSLVGSALYKNVRFEQKADYAGADKRLLTYDASLARLRKGGFARHARPVEAFGLLIDNLENKLSGALKDVADDMLKSYGEWLSAAFERKGNNLTVYIDPENIKWNGTIYEWNGKPQSSSEHSFNIAGIPSNTLVDMKRFSEEFVKLFYGKKANELPEVMKTGGKRAQAYLREGLWPVGRGNFYYVYIVGIVDRASRGVAQAQKKVP